jgi:hypothetical protein
LTLRRVLTPILASTVLAACSETNLLPSPIFQNAVDSSTMYALSSTELGTPSGFDLFRGQPVRPELGEPFDFVVDFADGQAQLQPGQVIGVQQEAGYLVVNEPFDAIPEAPVDEYISDSALVLTPALVFVMRSRINRLNCSVFVQLPHYGKFRVLSVDTAARSVTFEHLVNLNCGYRDLEVGLPAN